MINYMTLGKTDKVKVNAYSSLQLASPLRKFKCLMGSHSVMYLPHGKGDIPTLPHATEAATQFSDPGAMQDWVDLFGLILNTEWYTRP